MTMAATRAAAAVAAAKAEVDAEAMAAVAAAEIEVAVAATREAPSQCHKQPCNEQPPNNAAISCLRLAYTLHRLSGVSSAIFHMGVPRATGLTVSVPRCGRMPRNTKTCF